MRGINTSNRHTRLVSAIQGRNGSMSIWWFVAPVTAGLAAILLLCIMRSPNQVLAAIVAYINCVLGSVAIFHFARKNSPEAFIPVLSLFMLLISWPLSSLYFAIFAPEATYNLSFCTVDFLAGNLRVQMCVFLFLMCYLPIVIWALRIPASGPAGYVRSPGRTANYVAVFGISIIFADILSKLVNIPSAVVYIINGLWLYFCGALLVPGALFTFMNKRTKIFLAVTISLAVFFFTLGNGRGMAIRPCAFVLFGILFLSKLEPKTKLLILLIGILCFPVYVVIGNTTRTLLGRQGYTNLAVRFDALQNWQKAARNESFLGQTFGRLSYVGGQRIITATPEEYPYLELDPIKYSKELCLSLLPGAIVHSGSCYRGSSILNSYGLTVNDKTSVEVSMLGSFWLLGGYAAIFFGSMAEGLLQAILIAVVRRAGRIDSMKRLFLLAVLGPFLIASSSQDFISQCRSFLWCIIIGSVAYRLLSLYTGQPIYSQRKRKFKSAYGSTSEAGRRP